MRTELLDRFSTIGTFRYQIHIGLASSPWQ
jgi:hypothetical protein